MVGGILPECPTMSALAKFTTITSKVFSSIALMTASATPCADISGLRSYVATLGDWIMHAILARKRLFDATVEEVRDVSILLGLGHAQVSHVEIGHDVCQDIAQRLGRRHDRQSEVLVVPRHADIGQVFGHAIARDNRIEFRGAFEFRAVQRSEVRCCAPDSG